MLFKDHLKLVTDAGAVLHLGWDYDTPYSLDPLNGVDVDIQTAQGINQTGTTVERQSVAGVSRTLSVVFWGSHALDNARNFARKLPYYTTGTMYFEDAYFTRFVVQKTPYFSSYTEPRCELMLYSPKPYWYGLTATARVQLPGLLRQSHLRHPAGRRGGGAAQPRQPAGALYGNPAQHHAGGAPARGRPAHRGLYRL